MCRECMPQVPDRIRSCGCGCGCGFRRFFTPREEIGILEDYKKQLQREIAGIEKRIEDLKG